MLCQDVRSSTWLRVVLGHVVVNLEFFSGVERTRNEEKTLQRAAKGNNENEMGKGKREERQQNFDFVRNFRIDSREIKKRKAQKMSILPVEL